MVDCSKLVLKMESSRDERSTKLARYVQVETTARVHENYHINYRYRKASARHHIYPLEKANVQDRNDSPGWGEGKRAYGESNTPKTSLTDSVRGQFICSLQMGQHRRRYIFFNITHGGSTARTARIVRQSRSRRYFLSLLDCRIPVSRGSTCYGRTCMNIKCRVTRGAFYHAPGDPSISFDSNRLSNT